MKFASIIEILEQFDAHDFSFRWLSTENAMLLFHGRDTVVDEIIGPQALALASQAIAWVGAPWLPEDLGNQDRAYGAVVKGKDGWIFRVNALQSGGMLEIDIRKLDSMADRHRLPSLPLEERHAWAWAQHDAAELAQVAPELGILGAASETRRL